jgi:glucose/arabinose dehydrogenase
MAALLAGVSLLTVLTGCDSSDPAKSPAPTAAPTPGPGQMVTIAGDGTSKGWDGKSPAAGHAIGTPGAVVSLPDGKLLITSDTAPQAMILDSSGQLTNLKLQLQVSRIVAAGLGGDLVGALDQDTLLTISPTDGAAKVLAKLPTGVAESRTWSVVRRTDGWWVQRGGSVVAVSDAGKTSPVTLPVEPAALATDGDDILVATKDEVVRITDGKATTRMSLRGLDLETGYSPSAIVADGKGGAYVAMTGQAAVAHATPNADPKLLLRGKAGLTRCGEVPIGDPLAAPLQEIAGLALRGTDLVVSDRACNKLYQYGLPK